MYLPEMARAIGVLSSASSSQARIPRVICWVGITSMLTDIAAEMVATVLPVYLFSVLQLSPAVFGLLDGIYQGGAAIVALVAGAVADRIRNNKKVALQGYVLSVIATGGLLFSIQWGLLSAAVSVFLDRVGKGIRVAPRDALIASHVEPQNLGQALGVHRALDALGALIGPLLAASILWVYAGRFDFVLGVALIFGCAGLVVFQRKVFSPVAVASRTDAGTEPKSTEQSYARRLIQLFSIRPYRRIMCAVGLLSVFTASDTLIYIGMQKRLELDLYQTPFIFVATSLVYMVSSIPIGRLADRFGGHRIVLAGYGLLVSAYLTAAATDQASITLLVFMVVAIGGFYAASDGVITAMVVESLPPPSRTSGLAALTALTGTAKLLASVLFGWIWQFAGYRAALSVIAVGLGFSVLAFAIFVLRKPRTSLEPQ